MMLLSLGQFLLAISLISRRWLSGWHFLLWFSFSFLDIVTHFAVVHALVISPAFARIVVVVDNRLILEKVLRSH